MKTFQSVLAHSLARLRMEGIVAKFIALLLIQLDDLPNQHVHAVVDVDLLEVLRVRLDPHEEAAEGGDHRRLLDAPAFSSSFLNTLPYMT